MKLKDKIIQKYDEKHVLRRLVEDYTFRTKVTFVWSTICTIAMASFNAATGILYSSIWYGSMAIYFVALMIVRISLLVTRSKIDKKHFSDETVLENKKQVAYLCYGIVFVLMVAALTSMLAQMVAANKPVKTGMIIAIANAAYAFYKMGMAIYTLVKAIRLNDILLRIVRNLGVIDAAVSMLALAVTLITTFGEVAKMKPVLIVAAVAVALITILVGGYMIVKSIYYFAKNKKRSDQ